MKALIARIGLTLLAVFLVAAITHLASVLLLPWLAPRDSYLTLAAAGPTGVVRPLPRVEPGDAGPPFRDPAVASALCRYDLDEGPLRVGFVPSPQVFMALSFYSRRGAAFYGLTDRSALDSKVEVRLMTQAQLERAESRDDEDEPVHEVRVVAPQSQGFVLFDALPRIGGLPVGERALGSIRCEIERDF